MPKDINLPEPVIPAYSLEVKRDRVIITPGTVTCEAFLRNTLGLPSQSYDTVTGLNRETGRYVLRKDIGWFRGFLWGLLTGGAITASSILLAVFA